MWLIRASDDDDVTNVYLMRLGIMGSLSFLSYLLSIVLSVLACYFGVIRTRIISFLYFRSTGRFRLQDEQRSSSIIDTFSFTDKIFVS